MVIAGDRDWRSDPSTGRRFGGRELQPTTAWHAANPRHARGANDYGCAEYGLDEAALQEQFSVYMQRFDIPRERDAPDTPEEN